MGSLRHMNKLVETNFGMNRVRMAFKVPDSQVTEVSPLVICGDLPDSRSDCYEMNAKVKLINRLNINSKPMNPITFSKGVRRGSKEKGYEEESH